MKRRCRKRIYRVSLMLTYTSIDKDFSKLDDALIFVKDNAHILYSFEFYIIAWHLDDPMLYSGIVKDSNIYFDVYNHKLL